MFQNISEDNFGSANLQHFHPLRLQFTCFQCQNIYLQIYNIFTQKYVDFTLNIRSNIQSTVTPHPSTLISTYSQVLNVYENRFEFLV